MNAGRPPRVAEWLLERALKGDRREPVLGDLNEEFEIEEASRGRRHARRWYWVQTWSLITAFAGERSGGTSGHIPRSEGGTRIDTMRHDLGYALRALRHNPMFTAVAIAVLGLGIGASSAIFSFVDGVLLRPLPYRDPAQLVVVWERPPGGTRNVISALNFLDWQRENAVFETIAAATNSRLRMTTTTGPVEVKGARVSAGYFDMLGVSAAAGRTFATGEDQPGHDRVVVLSHRFWLSRFSADAGIIRIYGVISYSVAQRTREIGIRPALGATRSGIVALVLRQAAVTIAIGLAIGTAAALALTGLMANLLFGVQPRDPAGLASAAAILAASAFAAAYLPARRAARLDPIKALRIA